MKPKDKDLHDKIHKVMGDNLVESLSNRWPHEKDSSSEKKQKDFYEEVKDALKSSKLKNVPEFHSDL